MPAISVCTRLDLDGVKSVTARKAEVNAANRGWPAITRQEPASTMVQVPGYCDAWLGTIERLPTQNQPRRSSGGDLLAVDRDCGETARDEGSRGTIATAGASFPGSAYSLSRIWRLSRCRNSRPTASMST